MIFFSSSTASHSPVPPEAYTRIPCPGFDTSGNEKDALVLYGWVVKGQLQVSNLRSAWWKLLQAWPILAARLRIGAKAKADEPLNWFYLVPQPDGLRKLKEEEEAKEDSDKSRIFSYVDRRPQAISSVYSFTRGSELPQDRPSVARIDDNLDLWAPNSARSVKELTSAPSRACVTVHVTSFEDATMVAFSTPHVLCDGVGGKEIAEAWSAIVRGEPAPGPLTHLGTDPYSSLSTPSAEPPSPPGWRVFGTLDLIRFGIRFATDVFFWRPPSVIENREVYLPKTYLEAIKKKAMDDLGDDGRWVSTSDAVLAWIIKRAHAGKLNDSRILSVLYPSNLRWLPPAEGMEALPLPYLQNGAFTVVLPELAASEFVSGLSLGELAHLIRTTLETQTTPAEIRKSLTWRLWSRGKVAVFFAPTSHWFLVTNWRRMKLYDLDFGGEVMKVWGHGIHPVPMRNSFGQVADDPSGGLWLGGYLSQKEWEEGFGEFMEGSEGKD
ncbi:hypothetical protein IE53DRAFT_392294 [Violaceomyces palustris]|uniref:Uncharacterized protein n=1 Tax=Violaceomyces palustris TaxID=1673888 RepID=A0ACD0P2D7_9BASI|nr:hypothetical protein IE53DRAFT_392294 [Violaceomyces palustris]